jgi:hypothetical protein
MHASISLAFSSAALADFPALSLCTMSWQPHITESRFGPHPVRMRIVRKRASLLVMQ